MILKKFLPIHNFSLTIFSAACTIQTRLYHHRIRYELGASSHLTLHNSRYTFKSIPTQAWLGIALGERIFTEFTQFYFRKFTEESLCFSSQSFYALSSLLYVPRIQGPHNPSYPRAHLCNHVVVI